MPILRYHKSGRGTISSSDGFYTQSTRSFSDYLTKLKVTADYLKGRTTIGELTNLPNAYLHHYYKENFVKGILREIKDAAEARNNQNSSEGKEEKDMSTREIVDMRGISLDDLEDALEDTEL